MIKEFAYKIRHSTLLANADWLWNALRSPYHRFINLSSKGVPVQITNGVTIRIPPDFYKPDLNTYEVDSIKHLVTWIQKNPNCYILDIGCSVGYVSAISLFASESCQLVAFDSDLQSLKATKRMCEYASGNRLRVVYGFVSEISTTDFKLNVAVDKADFLLETSKLEGKAGSTKYVNLDHDPNNVVPTNSIDTLYEDVKLFENKILIKCDVEGAELFVLKGSINFMKAYRPNLLLSVHPDLLPVFGFSVHDVNDFLHSHNYSVKVISVDHEEHWWCTPSEKEA